jgi:hypothetical protein
MLADLVDLVVQMERDAGRPEVAVHRRDRALVGSLPAQVREPRALLGVWLDALRRTETQLPGQALGAVYRLQIFLLLVLGLAVGWGAAAAVYSYDGSRPVNVVQVLAVFVGAQLLLLLPLGVVLLPHRWTRRVPGFVAVQEALAWLSPGQLIRLLARWLPEKIRQPLASAAGSASPQGRELGRVRKWAVLFPAQVFAIAFNLGALAGCLYLIAFSDLAFAWSTTLEPDPARVHRLTGILSSPWAALAPHAVPSIDLIRETLYYRQKGVPELSDPTRWGQWWPFLVASMVTYGLLPRLALLALAGGQLRRSLRRAFVEMPGVTVVLDRLSYELVSTQATSPEVPGGAASAEPALAAGVSASLDAGELGVVNWNGLEVADESLATQCQAAWSRPVIAVHHAGGRRSISQDQETVAALATSPGSVGIALVVKAWEPPMMELLDFVRELRQSVGPTRLILVAPVGIQTGGRLAPPEPADLARWEKRLRDLRDPALAVRSWHEGGAG